MSGTPTLFLSKTTLTLELSKNPSNIDVKPPTLKVNLESQGSMAMPVRYVKVGDMFVEATSAFNISEDGELLTSWHQDGIHLKNMYLLFDSHDRPINAANEYLIHCKAVNQLQDLSCIAKGLTLFFSFLEREQLCWSDMPRASHMRPLYRFRNYLQALHDEIDPLRGKRQLASSTVKSYRGAVVGMYAYWMGYG
ncbi:hypothetical protein M8368_11270, partial [Enterobacter kobei]|nr:hypothetical protein [Enterobacter kobei]